MNVVSTYTNYLIDEYDNILKLLLGRKYKANIIHEYILEYINNRYYGNFKKDVFFHKMEEKYASSDYIISLNQVFDYVLYLDDIKEHVDVKKIFEIDITDSSLYFNENNKSASFFNYVNNVLKKKSEFFDIFDTELFELVFNKVKNNVFFVDIDHKIKISKLYSSYAKDKAYKSGVINENRVLILYHMLSKKVLREKIEKGSVKDFYILDFPSSLYTKTRKIKKFLEALDNPLMKEVVGFYITYTDYLKHKGFIDGLIHDGYKIDIFLDNSFKIDKDHLDSLVIFDKIILDRKYRHYDKIKSNEEKIRSSLISI